MKKEYIILSIILVISISFLVLFNYESETQFDYTKANIDSIPNKKVLGYTLDTNFVCKKIYYTIPGNTGLFIGRIFENGKIDIEELTLNESKYMTGKFGDYIKFNTDSSITEYDDKNTAVNTFSLLK